MDDDYAEDFDVYFERAATLQHDYCNFAVYNSHAPVNADRSTDGNRRTRHRRASLQTNLAWSSPSSPTVTSNQSPLKYPAGPSFRRPDLVRRADSASSAGRRQPSPQYSPRRRRLSSARSATIDIDGADNTIIAGGEISPDVRHSGPCYSPVSPRRQSSSQSTPSSASVSPGVHQRRARRGSSSSTADGSDSPKSVRRATTIVEDPSGRSSSEQFPTTLTGTTANAFSLSDQSRHVLAQSSSSRRRTMSLTPSPRRSTSCRSGCLEGPPDYASVVESHGDRASDSSTSTETGRSDRPSQRYHGLKTSHVSRGGDSLMVERHFSTMAKGVVGVRGNTAAPDYGGPSTVTARPRCSHASFDAGSSSDSDERCFDRSAAGPRRRASCTAAVVITEAKQARQYDDTMNDYRELYVGLQAVGDDDVDGKTTETSSATATTNVFNVLVVGESGVGKSELIRLFTNAAHADDSCDSSSSSANVTVTVDGRQTRLVFVECSPFFGASATEEADAYLVVYSMTDRASFRWAVSFISDVTQHHADDVTTEGFKKDAADLPAVILVANKADLVRKRQVSASEASDVCKARRCKYAELSAAIGHRVDALLVGVASQLELRLRQRLTTTTPSTAGRSNGRSARSLWSTSAGRIKAVTKFLVRGLMQRQQLEVHSSCADLMNL